jgi:RecG-like helicase
MATRKKKVKSKPKLKAKKPAPRKAKVKSKKKKAAPKVTFDAASTQQIAIAEIVGDIEERMALDRLSDG